MSLLPILTYPHPSLRKKALAVTVFDEKLSQLAEDMLETMYADEGIGLAAPQVNIPQRLIVMDLSEEGNSPQILINPEIIEKTGSVVSQEGCLSIPDLYMEIERYDVISVRAQNLKGAFFSLEKVTALLSRCLQHEIDHLNGVLAIDHLSPLKRTMIEKKIKKMACKL